MTPGVPEFIAYQRPDAKIAIRLPDGTEKVCEDLLDAKAWAYRWYAAEVRFEVEPLTELELAYLHGETGR